MGKIGSSWKFYRDIQKSVEEGRTCKTIRQEKIKQLQDTVLAGKTHIDNARKKLKHESELRKEFAAEIKKLRYDNQNLQDEIKNLNNRVEHLKRDLEYAHKQAKEKLMYPSLMKL